MAPALGHRLVTASTQQQQQQQAASTTLDEDRRASGSQASTSSASVAAASPMLERLLPREGGGQPRSTAVDARFRPFLDEWDKGFVDAEEEPEGYWLEVVEGAVPAGLRGTLFRCGLERRAGQGRRAAWRPGRTTKNMWHAQWRVLVRCPPAWPPWPRCLPPSRTPPVTSRRQERTRAVQCGGPTHRPPIRWRRHGPLCLLPGGRPRLLPLPLCAHRRVRPAAVCRRCCSPSWHPAGASGWQIPPFLLCWQRAYTTAAACRPDLWWRCCQLPLAVKPARAHARGSCSSKS